MLPRETVPFGETFEERIAWTKRGLRSGAAVVRAAIERVAARLGNTPTICRKCYVHPEILSLYAEGALLLQVKERVEGELREDLATLKPEESAVLSLLEGRLNRDLEAALQESVKEVDKRTEMPSRSVTKNGSGFFERLAPRGRYRVSVFLDAGDSFERMFLPQRKERRSPELLHENGCFSFGSKASTATAAP